MSSIKNGRAAVELSCMRPAELTPLRGLALTDDESIRRSRARIVGWFNLAGLPGGVLTLLGSSTAAATGTSPPLPLGIGILVAQAVVTLVALRQKERLGERQFLLLQLTCIAGMTPSLFFSTPPGSLRSSELLLLCPLVISAVFALSRWTVAASTVACIVGANAITAHRLSTTPDVLSEAVGELIAFTLITVVVRALRESAMKALVSARLGELTDPLTGLPNRRGFEHAGSVSWERRARVKLPIALLVLDVDHFKRVNDTFGHAAGDELLRRLSDVLRRHLRPEDVSVRMGGEEFAVLIAVEPGHAPLVAERLRAAVETELSPVTISIGVVETVPAPTADLTTAEALWRVAELADSGLYEAKRTGRNRVVVVPSDPATLTTALQPGPPALPGG